MLPLLLNGPISHFADFECYVTFLFLVLAAVGTCIGLSFLFKRLFARLYLILVCVVGIVFWLLGLDYLFYISIVGLAVGIVAFLLANQNETRSLTANNMIGKSGRIFRKSKVKPESLFDREAMYRKIENAVTILSKAKIGALITFEKKNRLDEMMQSASGRPSPPSCFKPFSIQAPVSTTARLSSVTTRSPRPPSISCPRRSHSLESSAPVIGPRSASPRCPTP